MSRTHVGLVCLLSVATGMAFGQTRAAYLEVSKAQVKSDRSKEWEDGVKKLVDINRRLKGDHWVTLETLYGDSGSFLFSSSRENLAAVESGSDAFMRALKEGMGPLGDKLMRDLGAYSASFKSEIRRRRWDLSVNAPADTAGMMELVGHSRFIRTIRMDLKAGRGMEYIEAWKPWQEEIGKVKPAIAALVSESITGPPALSVALYYKSMAQMDADNASIAKALESSAYRNLMKVSGEALAMTNWEIHRVRPELSNPPDEIVKADPAFWKPEPAALTSSKKNSGAADRGKK